MEKLKLLIITLFCSALMSLSSFAIEVRVGIAAGFTQIDTSGSETLKDTSEVTTHTEQANVIIPTIFAEIAMDNGLGVGYDHVSGSADLAGSTRTSTLPGSGTGSDSGDNSANAEIDGLNTIYLIKSFDSGFLVKVGLSQADINTKEVLASGSTYGNKTVDGTMLGIGWGAQNDSGLFVRSSVEWTDYDSISLTSGVADAVTGTSNVIKASVDTTTAKFSVGKAF